MPRLCCNSSRSYPGRPARQKLVRLNGIPDAKAGGISSWLDELFRDIFILSSDTGNRSLAQTKDTDLLLETVATMPHESPQSS